MTKASPLSTWKRNQRISAVAVVVATLAGLVLLYQVNATYSIVSLKLSSWILLTAFLLLIETLQLFVKPVLDWKEIDREAPTLVARLQAIAQELPGGLEILRAEWAHPAIFLELLEAIEIYLQRDWTAEEIAREFLRGCKTALPLKKSLAQISTLMTGLMGLGLLIPLILLLLKAQQISLPIGLTFLLAPLLTTGSSWALTHYRSKPSRKLTARISQAKNSVAMNPTWTQLLDEACTALQNDPEELAKFVHLVEEWAQHQKEEVV